MFHQKRSRGTLAGMDGSLFRGRLENCAVTEIIVHLNKLSSRRMSGSINIDHTRSSVNNNVGKCEILRELDVQFSIYDDFGYYKF